MKQILQNLKDGSTELAEVPCPRLAPGHLLLRTTRTLISAGTERMLVDFGKANPLEKARQQPDKVRQVLEKVRTDGLAPTLAAVRNKLEQPLPLGYCQVGVVAGVGGDRQSVDARGPTSFAPLSPDPSPARGEGSEDGSPAPPLAPSPLAGEGWGEGVTTSQAVPTRPAFAIGDRVISNGRHAEMVAL